MSTKKQSVIVHRRKTFDRISLNINEIKTRFSSFLAKVSKGETVIVCKGNVPIAEIKPITSLPNKKRPLGLAGKEYPHFKINDTFFWSSPGRHCFCFNNFYPWPACHTIPNSFSLVAFEFKKYQTGWLFQAFFIFGNSLMGAGKTAFNIPESGVHPGIPALGLI